ncbi:MAG: PspA/IM30 family protein [Lachnospiraceae bacterium]|jgi:phage shock protein A|nr:PspA/IM30 family protein [Lachnospiraceae bacterium]SDA72923.1 phage shock protein A (PspA) family protein [Lachnospiraceae bacterium G11]
MGILTRFKDIMSANINSLLDKAEDPEKMIDQYLRNLESDLGSVKAETAAVMAEEKSAKRKLDECTEEIAKMADYAKKAVAAGNDDEARQFLTKKSELTEKVDALQKQYDICTANAAKMREMHDKLEEDIKTLKGKRDTLKTKVKVAETQKKMSQLGSGLESAGNNMAAFDRMEEKVNKMLDEADAMDELNKTESKESFADLEKKYDGKKAAQAIDDELAALKSELGM